MASEADAKYAEAAAAVAAIQFRCDVVVGCKKGFRNVSRPKLSNCPSVKDWRIR